MEQRRMQPAPCRRHRSCHSPLTRKEGRSLLCQEGPALTVTGWRRRLWRSMCDRGSTQRICKTGWILPHSRYTFRTEMRCRQMWVVV